MVQALDSLINKPVYNAVNINIKKPEVNSKNNNCPDCISNDNGIYNAVKINIDKPAVNPQKKIYDYPVMQGPIPFEMTNFNPIPLPQGFPVAAEYHSASFIIPDNKTPKVPAPNYTTTEAEKGIENLEAKEAKEDKTPSGVTFHGTNPTIKRPEIVPSEDIKPEIDILLVTSNLNSEDFDTQALQMEEIARIAIDNPEAATPFVVRDVFKSLIAIVNKDSSTLSAPSEKQIEARKKLIENFVALEKNPKTKEAPNKLSEEDIALANTISPMEQAERNKEYALYTMAVLSKIFMDGVEKETGNVVPFTDIPGVSSMVDALRYNPNSGVKAAAIDSLMYIKKPEYKEELSTLINLAKADKNPIVSQTATKAMEKINK